ncbi:MAG: FadR family transcriptional regulator [Treponema sp.]|nr:FadR family transcriptional regulator [Treponema sp.]
MDKINYTVNKINLYEQIADTLEQAIIRQDTRIEKLPSEQELSKRFKVSRTVVREALKILKERGLVQLRNGEGSYISKPNADTVSSAVSRIIQMDNISNDHLHNMRLILETASARLSALHARPKDVKRLEHILEQMREIPLPTDKRIVLDSEFHRTIAYSGGNELLGMFVEVMTLLLKDYMIKGFPNPLSIKNTIMEHNEVLEAIRNRDPDGAEEAIRGHLSAARKNVARYEQKKRKSASGGKMAASADTSR